MSRTAPRWWALAAALGVGLLLPDLARTQQIEVSAAAVLALPRSSLLLAGERETITGTWLGGALAVKTGRVLLSGTGLRGTLTPSDNTRALERDGGELTGLLRFEPKTWLGFETAYTVRAFSSVAGYQRWEILGFGVRVSAALGSPALRAYARGSYFPTVSVTGQRSPNLGLEAEAGVTAAVRRVPLVLGLSYRLERYDFPGDARLEQFDRLAVQLGWRITKGR